MINLLDCSVSKLIIYQRIFLFSCIDCFIFMNLFSVIEYLFGLNLFWANDYFISLNLSAYIDYLTRSELKYF